MIGISHFNSRPWPLRRIRPANFLFLSAIALALGSIGCSHLAKKQPEDIVSVLPKQTFLRDRVAAVSNRVAMVQNGEQLQVLERGRRFLKVKTNGGQIGWIEARAVVEPAVVNAFATLQKDHQHDAVIATGVLRDDGYMHVKPGRETDRFYLLPENDKLQLLVRASVPKEMPAQAPVPVAKPASASITKPAVHAGTVKSVETTPGSAAASSTAVSPPAEPVPMEDWWLVRDSQGKVGWVMARRMDVDVPDEIAGYADGQKIVGAYLLNKVDDPESNFADKMAPEYITVLNPYKDGLPYDFSQIRVFTWNLRKHRYETAFRQRNIEGFLPVIVSNLTLDKAGPVPTFQVKLAVGDSSAIDPMTGITHPTQTETVTYRLDGAIVKKVDPSAPSAAQPASAAPAPPKPQTTGGSRHARRHHHHG